MIFSKSGGRAGGQQFLVGSREHEFLGRAAAPAQIYLPAKFVGGV